MIKKLVAAFLTGVLVVFLCLWVIEVSVSEIISIPRGEYAGIEPLFISELIKKPGLLVPIAPAFLGPPMANPICQRSIGRSVVKSRFSTSRVGSVVP